MGTLLSCNKQIGWICLSLPWNQMGPHPLGVLLRGAFLASKWASHHTSRGDMYIIYIYIYIRTVGGYTQDYTYQSIRYVCTKYLNKYIYIHTYLRKQLLADTQGHTCLKLYRKQGTCEAFPHAYRRPSAWWKTPHAHTPSLLRSLSWTLFQNLIRSHGARSVHLAWNNTPCRCTKEWRSRIPPFLMTPKCCMQCIWSRWYLGTSSGCST